MVERSIDKTKLVFGELELEWDELTEGEKRSVYRSALDRLDAAERVAEALREILRQFGPELLDKLSGGTTCGTYAITTLREWGYIKNG